MNTLTDWKQFFQFLIRPTFLEKEINITSRLKITFNIFILKVILGGLIILISTLILVPLFELNIESIEENLKPLYNPILLFAMVAILEEFSFRGFLSKFNPLLFSISVAGIIGIYFKKIGYHNMVFEPEGLIEMGILMILIFSMAFFISKKNIVKMTLFWNSNFRFILIASAFLFAFIHFFNLSSLDLKNLPLTISQFLGAFLLSFVRMRSGILFAIFIHFIWNLMLGL